MSETTQTYEIESPVKFDGKIRKIGSKVEMTDEVAGPLLDLGRIKKAKAAKLTIALKLEAEVIAAVGKAQTLPELNKLIKGDDRQPVLDAFGARKKIIEERPGAKDVIKLIKAAKTVAEVNEIVGKDDRSGVTKEAEKKRQALTVNI